MNTVDRKILRCAALWLFTMHVTVRHPMGIYYYGDRKSRAAKVAKRAVALGEQTLLLHYPYFKLGDKWERILGAGADRRQDRKEKRGKLSRQAPFSFPRFHPFLVRARQSVRPRSPPKRLLSVWSYSLPSAANLGKEGKGNLVDAPLGSMDSLVLYYHEAVDPRSGMTA